MSPAPKDQTEDHNDISSSSNSNGDAQPADEPHQHQASSTTHRQEDEWKYRAPYNIHKSSPSSSSSTSKDSSSSTADENDDEDDEDFPVKWRGRCHCGRVRYQLRRERPLASKYCHCTTCQRLHGAPFQWAAVFPKEDLRFTRGHHDLGWYDPGAKSQAHENLPCKVQCGYCRAPVMDEGRNMILLFPTLVEGVNTARGRWAFAAKCHMFYPQRVVDFRGDGKVKYAGLEGRSDVVDDEGNVVKKRKKGDEEDD